MPYLLDTNVFLHALIFPERLGPFSARVLAKADPADLRISVMTIYEAAVLVEKKRILLDSAFDVWLKNALQRAPVKIVPATADIITDAFQLPGFADNDPMDRIIVATARTQQLTLLTSDAKILAYKFVDARH